MIRSGPLLLQLATLIYFVSGFVVKKQGVNCTQNLHPQAKTKPNKRGESTLFQDERLA